MGTCIGLDDHQLEASKEAVQKKRCIMSLPIGYGKTCIGINIASSIKGKTLVICQKTLVQSWINECHKFSRSKIGPLETINSIELDIIVATPEQAMRSYKLCGFDKNFSERIGRKMYYTLPKRPIGCMTDPIQIIHGYSWSCLIVDEAHTMSNIKTKKCRGISTICASHRYLLSATIISEPNKNNYTGLHCMMHTLYDQPSIFDFSKHVIKRDTNPAFTPPPTEFKIITFMLGRRERALCNNLENKLKRMEDYLKIIKGTEKSKTIMAQKIRGQKLALLTLLRLMLISPAHAVKNATGWAGEIMRTISKNEGLEEWVHASSSDISTRIRELKKIVDSENAQKIVIFSCFRTVFEIVRRAIGRRPVFEILSQDSAETRGETVRDFSNSSNGILLTTYQLGSEGLNLQKATVCILLDRWWNRSRQDQAMGRILRRGQEAPLVKMYCLISDMNMEQEMLKKHKGKLDCIKKIWGDGVPDYNLIPKLDIISASGLTDDCRAVEHLVKEIQDIKL